MEVIQAYTGDIVRSEFVMIRRVESKVEKKIEHEMNLHDYQWCSPNSLYGFGLKHLTLQLWV